MDEIEKQMRNLIDTLKLNRESTEQVNQLAKEVLLAAREQTQENRDLAVVLKEQIAQANAQVLRLTKIADVQLKWTLQQTGIKAE